MMPKDLLALVKRQIGDLDDTPRERQRRVEAERERVQGEKYAAWLEQTAPMRAEIESLKGKTLELQSNIKAARSNKQRELVKQLNRDLGQLSNRQMDLRLKIERLRAA